MLEVFFNKAQQLIPLVAGTVKTLRFFAGTCVRRLKLVCSELKI